MVSLKTAEDLRVWSVRLRDPDRTGFRYRVTVSYRDGGFEEGPLVEHAGGGVLPIKVREPRTSEVVLVPNRLDFAQAPLTKVVLNHPASGTTTTFTFTEAARAVWSVPIRPNEPLSYTAEVTHFPEDGDPVELEPTTETDTAYIIPPYTAPKPGALKIELRPTLIDFAKTPLVTVDVLYEDEENGFRREDTFAFESKEPLLWAFDVPGHEPAAVPQAGHLLRRTRQRAARDRPGIHHRAISSSCRRSRRSAASRAESISGESDA